MRTAFLCRWLYYSWESCNKTSGWFGENGAGSFVGCVATGCWGARSSAFLLVANSTCSAPDQSPLWLASSFLISLAAPFSFRVSSFWVLNSTTISAIQSTDTLKNLWDACEFEQDNTPHFCCVRSRARSDPDKLLCLEKFQVRIGPVFLAKVVVSSPSIWRPIRKECSWLCGAGVWISLNAQASRLSSLQSLKWNKIKKLNFQKVPPPPSHHQNHRPAEMFDCCAELGSSIEVEVSYSFQTHIPKTRWKINWTSSSWWYGKCDQNCFFSSKQHGITGWVVESTQHRIGLSWVMLCSVWFFSQFSQTCFDVLQQQDQKILNWDRFVNFVKENHRSPYIC